MPLAPEAAPGNPSAGHSRLSMRERTLAHRRAVVPPHQGRALQVHSGCIAQWELWVDPYRVLYDVEGGFVRVKMVARKIGERLYEDGKEINTHV